MEKLPNSIKETIQRHDWKRLLLAVSGGLDSICLAHFFVTHKTDLGIEWLGIAHIHHGLRESTADRDAEFTREFANKLNIPFFIKNLDGSALKTANGSLEENARNARYEALLEFAKKNCADAIVTAHHAGDQAETVYLRLRRGVSLAGLRGIQEVRSIESTKLYRPLLNIPRTVLAEYARENNLQWCEDESNADTKFARNQIRLHSLPLLEKTFPGATQQLCRIARTTEKATAKIQSILDMQFEKAVIPMDEWPFVPSLSPFQNVLALDIQKLQINFHSELFRLWLNSKGFRFPLDTFDSLFQTKEHTNSPLRYQYRSRFTEKCRNIIWVWDSAKTTPPSNLYFAVEKERFSQQEGCWRKIQKDDMLQPLDGKIRIRPLVRWLREKGIPSWMHDSLDVFAQGSRILYVSGILLKATKDKNESRTRKKALSPQE